jgi:hypothetical protein
VLLGDLAQAAFAWMFLVGHGVILGSSGRVLLARQESQEISH